MKKTLFLAYFSLFLVFFLPLAEQKAASAAPESSAAPVPAEQALLQEDPPAPSVPAAEPEEARTIRVLREDAVEEMDLEDYLCAVVAAEMPASFPEEALKAQAVAARTFALYCAGTGKHPDADVCTDPAHCQAWRDERSLRDSWGPDYETWSEKIRRAVEDTAGQVLCYEGQPVFAAFHASSPGATEDSAAVWNPLPYLQSVSSPETASDRSAGDLGLRAAPGPGGPGGRGGDRRRGDPGHGAAPALFPALHGLHPGLCRRALHLHGGRKRPRRGHEPVRCQAHGRGRLGLPGDPPPLLSRNRAARKLSPALSRAFSAAGSASGSR